MISNTLKFSILFFGFEYATLFMTRVKVRYRVLYPNPLGTSWILEFMILKQFTNGNKL